MEELEKNTFLPKPNLDYLPTGFKVSKNTWEIIRFSTEEPTFPRGKPSVPSCAPSGHAVIPLPTASTCLMLLIIINKNITQKIAVLITTTLIGMPTQIEDFHRRWQKNQFTTCWGGSFYVPSECTGQAVCFAFLRKSQCRSLTLCYRSSFQIIHAEF